MTPENCTASRSWRVHSTGSSAWCCSRGDGISCRSCSASHGRSRNAHGPIVIGICVSTEKSKPAVIRTLTRTKIDDGSKSLSVICSESGSVASNGAAVVVTSGRSSTSACSFVRCGRMNPGGSRISTGIPWIATSTPSSAFCVTETCAGTPRVSCRKKATSGILAITSGIGSVVAGAPTCSSAVRPTAPFAAPERTALKKRTSCRYCINPR